MRLLLAFLPMLAFVACDPIAAQVPVALPQVANAGGQPLAVAPSFPLVGAFWNETASPLASGATFTGPTRDAGGATYSVWREASCQFVTDQASATDGAQLQASNDGVTWYVAIRATVTAGVPVRLSDRLSTRYWRCRLVNGGTAQTALNINFSFNG